MSEMHIGDGVYVSFKGGMIKLRTPRLDEDHYIFLEDYVFAEFVLWARGIGCFVDQQGKLTWRRARE
jgi:hypothetical protein